MKELISKLENYPIGICGTSLAFITLGNCWLVNGIYFIKIVAIIFAICAIALMLLKIIIFPKTMIEEIKNPVVGSFYPTIDMAGLLIASYFLDLAPGFAKGLWLTCIVVHAIIFVVFLTYRAKNFKLTDMVPSWFVILIGVVVASASSKGMGHPLLAQYLFYFGFFWYVVAWPVMLYRVYKCEKLEDHKLPTIGVMAAPGSLCIVGYLTSFSNLNHFILGFLIVTSLFNLVLVYTYITDFIRKGFKPTYAALTFPLAISVFAMYKTSAYISSMGLNGAELFKFLGNIEIFIATYVIFYVINNFIKLFLSTLSPKLESRFESNEGLFGQTIGEESLTDDKVEEEFNEYEEEIRNK
ncbi:MAG: TDT family transporter [Paraclostridium sp.]|uniref:TDT family transporter n=1 Tax=Paraclostridium sp. TaxID=2023273 RepID=UPI003F351F29